MLIHRGGVPSSAEFSLTLYKFAPRHSRRLRTGALQPVLPETQYDVIQPLLLDEAYN